MAVELAVALSQMGHAVTFRLPYQTAQRVHRAVRFIGTDGPAESYGLSFLFDTYQWRDRGDRRDWPVRHHEDASRKAALREFEAGEITTV